MSLWARLAREYLALRFRWIDRRRHQRWVLERFDGFELLVMPEVFHPALFHSSSLMADVLRDTPLDPDAGVLDLGCGSGYLALVAARRGCRVTAIDLNPDAVRCAKVNVTINRLEDRIEVRDGDLWNALTTERFDLVLFNPPFLPASAMARGKPARPWDLAWFEPSGLAERFAQGLPGRLTEHGKAWVVTSSHSSTDWAEVLAAHGLSTTTLRAKRLPTGEILAILEVRPRT